jgi:hypothetical protein
MLPVFMTNYAAKLKPIEEGKARINRSPGYQLDYAGGTLVVLVPEDDPGTRDAVLLAYRQPPDAGRRAVKAMRLALRSFEFGVGRG